MNEKGHEIFGFYGYSGSGKTSTIYRLIEAFAELNINIAVIKQTNKAISSEPPGKDTSGFRAAGAHITSFLSENETNFVLPKKSSLDEVIDTIKKITHVDAIFIEGAREAKISKIRFGDIPEREGTIFTYKGKFDELFEYLKRKMNLEEK